jgi:hypothetical protein
MPILEGKQREAISHVEDTVKISREGALQAFQAICSGIHLDI